jgi:hypothetical protein
VSRTAEHLRSAQQNPSAIRNGLDDRDLRLARTEPGQGRSVDETAKPAAPAGSPDLTPKQFIEQVAGVYKMSPTRFAFGSPKTFDSEDILEIVPFDDQSAYVRMKLDFGDGITGDIYGIATYAPPGTLVYDNTWSKWRAATSTSGDEHCAIKYVWSEETITTQANGCKDYHGLMDGIQFPRAKRATIRYLARLKNSREFKDALEEYSRRNAGAK